MADNKRVELHTTQQRATDNGQRTKRGYAWFDLVAYPIAFVLLAPLAWHLVQIVLSFAVASGE